MKKINSRTIFLISTILHVTFIAWLTSGEQFLLIYAFSTISCLLLLPFTYLLSSSFFNFIEKKFPDIETIKNKTTITLLLGEAVFTVIFVISALSMVFIRGTEEYLPQQISSINFIKPKSKLNNDVIKENNIIEIYEDNILTEYPVNKK